MLWMSGTSVNIFSMLITAMAFWTPLSAMFRVNSHFAPLASGASSASPEDSPDAPVSLLGPKLLYCLLNLAILAVALYKSHTMGLLPTPADWAAGQPVPSSTFIAF